MRQFKKEMVCQKLRVDFIILIYIRFSMLLHGEYYYNKLSELCGSLLQWDPIIQQIKM